MALAKRCRRLGIPLPGRGYWARIDAGQTPYRPKLPKREPQWHDGDALTVAPSVGAYSATILSSEEAQETLKSAAAESVPARIATLSVTATATVIDALPAVKRTAVRAKYSQRSGLVFERGERSGAIIDLDASQEVLERALLLADKLLRAAAALGWVFDDPLELRKKQGKPVADVESPASPEDSKEAPEPYKGRLLVEGEQVALRVEERLRHEVVEPTAAQLVREKREYGYHAPRKVSVPTGALRIVRLDTYRAWVGPTGAAGTTVRAGESRIRSPKFCWGSTSSRSRSESDGRRTNGKRVSARNKSAGARNGRPFGRPTRRSLRNLSGMQGHGIGRDTFALTFAPHAGRLAHEHCRRPFETSRSTISIGRSVISIS